MNKPFRKLAAVVLAALLAMAAFPFATVHAIGEKIAVAVELSDFDSSIAGGDSAQTLLWLRGTATTTGGVLRLTNNTMTQAGTVVKRNQIMLTDGFSTYFQIQMSNHIGSPGDGMSFMVYGNDTPEVGASGGGLGYAGIDNSIAVEFDTYINSGSDIDDPPQAHAAVMLNGDNCHTGEPAGSVTDYSALVTDIVNAWVDYNGSTVTCTFGTSQTRSDPANKTISRDIGGFLQGQNVFIGFSGSTGSARSYHDVLKWYFMDSYVSGGLTPTAGSYEQGASTIGITLDTGDNPTAATVATYDAAGVEMENQNIELFLDGVSVGSFNTGTDGYVYAVPNASLVTGSHALRAVTDGGASNFVTFNVTNAVPVASGVAVSVSGSLQTGETLTGIYTYSDAENNAEGASVFRWLRSDDASGTNRAAIATSKTYTVGEDDIGKYLSFEVTPVAAAGTSPGVAVESALAGPVVAIPVITAHPQNRTAESGETATFSVTATVAGGGTLSYRWQKASNGAAWSDIPNATGSSYTTPALGSADDGAKYRCVVTNTVGQATASAVSNEATLTLAVLDDVPDTQDRSIETGFLLLACGLCAAALAVMGMRKHGKAKRAC